LLYLSGTHPYIVCSRLLMVVSELTDKGCITSIHNNYAAHNIVIDATAKYESTLSVV
jgi:hypothetical protein